MYPRISWELAADPLRSVEHTLGTAVIAPYEGKRLSHTAWGKNN